ncbi:hypothetical protein [Streptomyces sp. NPDC047725]|uniref:hypothetical protein n=1 Tax=Streptomyces sp. NPDC047725 TaxID=3365487 RepID=UPI0037112F7F
MSHHHRVTSSVFTSPQKAVSAGQTVSHFFGGKSKAQYAPDCKAAGLMNSNNGGPYWTPIVTFC